MTGPLPHEPLVVSVVVPCMNSRRFLAQTIDSILQQDYPHIECIVVDGGSTDGTIELLHSYGRRIRWVSEPDGGHADAINKGWRMSRGRALAWLNADDTWQTPDAVGLAVRYLTDHPDVDLVYGDCGWIDEQGRYTRPVYCHPWDLRHAVEHADHCIPQPAAFIRRRVLETVGTLDTAIFTKDRELWLRIGLVGKIAYLPVRLAFARDTRGISFDGRRVAPAIVRVTRKFYTLPGVPAELKRIKRRAMSNAYLRGAYYAFVGGRLWAIVCGYILWATLIDPTNLRAVARQVMYCVRGVYRQGRSADTQRTGQPVVSNNHLAVPKGCGT